MVFIGGSFAVLDPRFPSRRVNMPGDAREQRVSPKWAIVAQMRFLLVLALLGVDPRMVRAGGA
jgi:hypothetical protein